MLRSYEQTPRVAGRFCGFVAALIATAGFGLVASSPAQAEVKCSLKPASGLLELRISFSFLQQTRIVRDGSKLLVLADRGQIQDCGGPAPTVHNVDRISAVTDDIERLTIDLGGGPLGPGATPEPDGSDEIEFALRSLDKSTRFPGFASLEVVGTEGDDSIVAGGLPGTQKLGVDLGTGPSSQPEVDVVLQKKGSLFLRALAGDDSIDGRGSPAFSGPFDSSIAMHGGEGEDTAFSGSWFGSFQGGPGNDRLMAAAGGGVSLAGHQGRDLLIGGSHRDVLDGDGGRDRIEGRGNDDLIAVQGDRQIDRVDCGAGHDEIYAEPDDLLHDCEIEH